VIKIKILGH